ncbi:MAG: TIGR00300 family protein [Spirochaetes bacterium]|nr:MAG: TIGR00300 family protein [Spirochaetota bacterium]
MKRRFVAQGHLIDSGILSSILNLIIAENGDYYIVNFEMGKTHKEPSRLEIELICKTADQLASLTDKLIQQGCYEKKAPEAVLKEAPEDRCAPEDFYSTTNHITDVFINGQWRRVAKQRMDGVIVVTADGPVCKKLRDIKKGDLIVCSPESVHVHPLEREREKTLFGFMSNDVSSERSVELAVTQIASEMKELKKMGKKIVAVAGPVIIHTGGAGALASLIREGYINGLLSGNALAVHDLEYQFFGTSLGIEMDTGKPTHEGHRNHLRTINRIYHHGSIVAAIEAGGIKAGVMYETIKKGIPYCLAGSIRDDGPLPETEMDMIKAQDRYAEIIEGASLVLMLSTMLHSIGTANMLPSWVKTVCIDINPAAVTKLSDRGSMQTISIVSDVGLFLRALADKLIEG